MATPEWTARSRNFEKEALQIAADRVAVTSHPLIINPPKVKVVPASKTSAGKKVEVVDNPLDDPLSALAGKARPAFADPLLAPPTPSASVNVDPVLTEDPLSVSEGQAVAQPPRRAQSSDSDHHLLLHTPWQQKKLQIKNDYTISGNIVVRSSAMNEFVGTALQDGSSARLVDKYDKRLANLEKRPASKDEKIEISQKEFENHVDKLSDDLNRCWKTDDRVGTLKVAITLSKLLTDTSVPSFYPSLFVLVIDVLDRFKDMVYNRLLGKAEEALNQANPLAKRKLKLPTDFTSSDVPSLAKEICRNWFYKTACIRELLPRIYVEITLLKCYRFLTDNDLPAILSRLGNMIRGLGDPLLAYYARMYLVVVGSEVCPEADRHTLNILQDSLFSFSMFKEPQWIADLDKQALTNKTYMFLLSPALEWIIKSVGRKNNTKEVFQSILQLYRDLSNDSMVLKHIIDSFDASHYAHASLGMVTLIKSADISCETVVDLFATLGRQLAAVPPPEDQRLPLLNEVWKIVSKSTDLLPYIKCASAWLDVVQRHYSEREMMVILGGLSARVTAQDVPDAAQPLLEHLLTSLIGQSSTFGTAVLTSEHLLKILDVFKGAKRVELCKDILESFKSQSKTNDPVLINTLFDLARIVHDSIDGLSAVNDVNTHAALLSSFIDQIDFGRDLEQQLSFYVDCRSAFSNMDQIKDKLVVSVTYLAMKAFRYVKGKHTKKTSNFVKACLAYCYITIPSLANVYRKLQLLSQCAQVALVNQHLPQTDAFLKAAISLLPDLPAYYEEDGKKVHFEERLSEYLNNLLAFLVVAPGHPELGPFYIVQGLLNALPKFAWNNNTPYQTKVLVNVLFLLATYEQKIFPYHIQGVQSNDELYGGAPGYLTDLQALFASTVADLLKLLSLLGEKSDFASKQNQARCALDLVNVLIAQMDLQPQVAELAYKLIDLASRNLQQGSATKADSQYLKNTVDFVVYQLERSALLEWTQAVIPKFRSLLK